MGAVGNHRVACSVCGDDSFKLSQMTDIGNGQLACPYDARGMHTADLEGYGSPQLKPPVNSRPSDETREASIVPLYQAAEAQLFNLLTFELGGMVPDRRRLGGRLYGPIYDSAPTRERVDVEGLGVASMYLYDLIVEDRRPAIWITKAKTQLQRMADVLLTRQAGSGVEAAEITTLIQVTCARPATTSTSGEYGAFFPHFGYPHGPSFALDGSYYSSETILGGMALLRAWQVFGDERYRTGYRAALTCLRRMQCAGYLVNSYLVRGSGSSERVPPGMWVEKIGIFSGAGTIGLASFPQIYTAGLLGLEFIAAAKAVEGDRTYGDAAATTDYASATAATLSEMAAAAQETFTTGLYDGIRKVTWHGFSPTTPALSFTGVTSDNPSQSATWSGNITCEQRQIAMAMRGWHAYSGYDSRVQAWWEFLQAQGQDPLDIPLTSSATAGQLWPYTNVDDSNWGVGRGTYDPSICLARYGRFHVTSDSGISADTNTDNFNNGANYDWTTVGLLAPIWSAREPAGFARAKELISRHTRLCQPGRHKDTYYLATGNDAQAQRILQQVYSGFDFQPSSGSALDAYEATWLGFVYRQQPRIFNVKDHGPRH